MNRQMRTAYSRGLRALVSLSLAALWLGTASAQIARPASEKPDSPPPKLEPLPEIKAPPGAEDNFEPVVTIRQKGKDTVEEYRRGGKVYMVKVIPGNGLPPYYLVDREGTGKLSPVDAQGNTLSGPQWLLFEF
jgi:hypothetical protein